jgi:hypothetical protein
MRRLDAAISPTGMRPSSVLNVASSLFDFPDLKKMAMTKTSAVKKAASNCRPPLNQLNCPFMWYCVLMRIKLITLFIVMNFVIETIVNP